MKNSDSRITLEDFKDDKKYIRKRFQASNLDALPKDKRKRYIVSPPKAL
jgi:hypothetical protein